MKHLLWPQKCGTSNKKNPQNIQTYKGYKICYSTINRKLKKSKRKLIIAEDKWKQKQNGSKSIGQSSFKGRVYSCTNLPQKIRETSSNLILHIREI